MKKKIAKTNFILIAILLLICLLLSVCSFNIPSSNNRFKGFLNSIPLGLDFSEGVTAVYEIKGEEGALVSNDMDDIVNRVQTLLAKDYNEFQVTKVDDNKIRITIPADVISSKYLVNRIQFNSSTTASENPTVTGEMIKSVKYTDLNGVHCAKIEFNKEGKAAFATLTSNISTSNDQALFILDQLTGSTIASVGGITETISTGSIYFPTNSKADAKTLVSILKSSQMGYDMELVGDEQESVEPTYFNSAKYIALGVSLLFVVGIMLIAIFKYKELGLITALSLSFYLIVSVIIFSLISSIQLTIASVTGIILSFIVTSWLHFAVIDKCHEEYKAGSKLPAAFKNGYKKSLQLAIDIFAIVFIISLLFTIWGVGAVRSFAYVSMIMSLVGAFTLLALFRIFTKMYMHINSAKGKKINFVKGEEVKNEK